MEQVFALIRNGQVESIIVASDSFIEQYRLREGSAYEHMIDVTGLHVGRGWLYNDGEFQDPNEEQE